MSAMPKDKSPLLQGTLDMLILKALEREPMHGFGLSLRLRELSREVFHVEMGSLYPALCRLEARDLIRGEWNVSEANRKARYYSLTSSGRKQLKVEIARWEALSSTINSMVRAT
jgi:PadR family transcriptional regulator, regulatory protein PadR